MPTPEQLQHAAGTRSVAHRHPAVDPATRAVGAGGTSEPRPADARGHGHDHRRGRRRRVRTRRVRRGGGVIRAVAIVSAVAAGVAGAACSPPGGEDEAGDDAGGAPEAGGPSTTSPYGPGWSAVHADAANTDYAPVEGPADVTLRWHRSLGGNVNLGATVDGSGRAYVTTAAAGCHLHALDAATGETVWCSEEVDRFTVASSPLLDAGGAPTSPTARRCTRSTPRTGRCCGRRRSSASPCRRSSPPRGG